MSQPSFHLDVHRHDGAARLTVAGELDLATAPGLEGALTELLDEPGLRVCIDLRKLRFMDSTGLRSLLRATERAAREDRELTIVRGPQPIARLFEVTGLESHLPLVDEPPASPA
jgi:anti-sigma B factor antagonist